MKAFVNPILRLFLLQNCHLHTYVLKRLIHTSLVRLLKMLDER